MERESKLLSGFHLEKHISCCNFEGVSRFNAEIIFVRNSLVVNDTFRVQLIVTLSSQSRLNITHFIALVPRQGKPQLS